MHIAMTDWTLDGLFELLDGGDVKEYVERRLFDDSVDSLDAHIERKQALAHPVRYSILYLIYEYGSASRKRLASETGRDNNKLQHHLRDLLDANLIAEIPAPDGADGRRTYYRITTLGKQEITADLRNLVGEHAETTRFESLVDPELTEGAPSDSDVRRRPLATIEGGRSDEFNRYRNDLQTQRQAFQQVTTE